MKKLIGTVAFVSILALNAPAYAQTTTAPATAPAVDTADDDDGFDFGWLGLLGLLPWQGETLAEV